MVRLELQQKGQSSHSNTTAESVPSGDTSLSAACLLDQSLLHCPLPRSPVIYRAKRMRSKAHH